MVLRRILLAALVLAVTIHGVSGTSQAHKNHEEARTAQGAPSVDRAAPAEGAHAPGAMDHPGGSAMEDAPPGTLSERAAAWLGKMHPAMVHFPIALFPASFALLALARRREGVAAVVRWLLIFAGFTMAGAALMGWISAGFAMSDTDPIQGWHRWIGTGLAAIGVVAALWVWRRRAAVRSRGMVALTGAITLALLIQGWLGGVLTHGLDHMRF